MIITEEIGNYPKDDTIVYKQKNEREIVSQNFTYKVITAENYPDKKILQVTHMPNCYSIPNNYKIQTISSELSATNATDLLYNNFTENKTRVSEILLFGLQFNKLKEYQEIKSHKKTLKPVNNISTSGLTKRATKVAFKVSEYYKYLAAIEPSLPREKAISEQKISINNLIEQNIKINVVNITITVAVHPNEIPHIIDKNIIEIIINSVERNSNKWSYTSLMGQDKLKNENTDSTEFQSAAKVWLKYFLTPSIGDPEDDDFIKGLYQPVIVIPYIHVLV
ncbi:hypothetical protein C1645_825207 [Glomus cerebriforme]|uniref:Uncharacterized protein n=1 Tax=Glomus cerebriforme TaxID=658196 RepID=A0A397STX8_9GLOM|nr:hypothetical protein C1645_825207 [Glomus cerebriforme]